MSLLFTPGKIGSLKLLNRIVRSATAERLADDELGHPLPKLTAIYQELVRGGVGLIITGHMFIHPSGKAHSEMTGINHDDMIPSLTELTQAVHQEGGLITVQINHGGARCAKECVADTIAPSAVDFSFLGRPAREMTADEIEMLVDSFGQAARRAKQAGFDAIQIHAAHGYLINQFLSPLVNRRTDKWGGEIQERMLFLSQVIQAARKHVGSNYPILIKLGMMDGVDGGLTLDESTIVVASLENMGVDAVELSGGIEGKHLVNIRKGIRFESDEAYFLPFAQKIKTVTRLPKLLVGGFRSRKVMERVLEDGNADFISLSRPLINEPRLPNLIRLRLQDKSGCLSSNNCWPKEMGTGIACKCPVNKIVPTDDGRRNSEESKH